MTTRRPPRPSPTRRPVAADPARQPRFFGLSASQLIATAFAAITATVAGSFLGVSGTVVGAALASVVSAVGNAVYSASIRRTGERVRAVVPAGQRARRSVRHPLPHRHDAPPELPSARPRPAPARRADAPRRARWWVVGLGSLGMFAAVLVGVTVIEALAGRPLADLVRGDSGSGTSLFGDGAGAQGDEPAPTVTRTVTPSVAVVTPTVTSTAPTHTVTVSPSVTVTAPPTSETPTSGSTASDRPSGATSDTSSGSASSDGSTGDATLG